MSKMYCSVLVTLCVMPCVALSVEMSVIWDSNIQSYGLRKGKDDNHISLVNFRNDINKTGYVYCGHTSADGFISKLRRLLPLVPPPEKLTS